MPHGERTSADWQTSALPPSTRRPFWASTCHLRAWRRFTVTIRSRTTIPGRRCGDSCSPLSWRGCMVPLCWAACSSCRRTMPGTGVTCARSCRRFSSSTSSRAPGPMRRRAEPVVRSLPCDAACRYFVVGARRGTSRPPKYRVSSRGCRHRCLMPDRPSWNLMNLSAAGTVDLPPRGPPLLALRARKGDRLSLFLPRNLLQRRVDDGGDLLVLALALAEFANGGGGGTGFGAITAESGYGGEIHFEVFVLYRCYQQRDGGFRVGSDPAEGL